MDEGIGPFPHQQFIRKVHEVVLHVFAQPGKELESLFKEQLREGSRNGTAIPKQLPAQSFDQSAGTGVRSSTLPGVRQQESLSLDH